MDQYIRPSALPEHRPEMTFVQDSTFRGAKPTMLPGMVPVKQASKQYGAKRPLTEKEQNVLSRFGIAFGTDTFTAGKYANKAFLEVLSHDAQYVKFILESDMSDSSLAQDAINLHDWIAHYRLPGGQ